MPRLMLYMTEEDLPLHKHDINLIVLVPTLKPCGTTPSKHYVFAVGMRWYCTVYTILHCPFWNHIDVYGSAGQLASQTHREWRRFMDSSPHMCTESDFWFYYDSFVS